MNPSAYYNISDLTARVRAVHENYDIVSFDLFDTLVVRRIADPDMIKAPVARFAAKLAKQAGLEKTAREFQEVRDETESEHRDKNGAQYPDREACYKDFMRETIEKFFCSALEAGRLNSETLFGKISRFEIELEKSVIVPRSEMLKIMRDLHDAGKKILVITDIYLTSDYISEILEHAGMSKFVSETVSSADTFHAKASGAAFKMLLEKHGVPPEKWLHIGDNAISDGARPASSGIHSMLLKDAGEKHRKAVFRRYAGLAETRPFWRGRLLSQMMLPLENENAKQSTLYRLGYTFFGLQISAFVLRIMERVQELGIKRVYFFSREGLLFFDIWKNLAPAFFAEGEIPEASYLCVSRRALSGPACARNGLVHANAHLALLPAGNRDMRDLCRVFGLDIGPLKQFLEKHGFSENTALNSIYPDWQPEHRARLDAFLSDPDVQEVIRGQKAECGKMLEKYLEQEGFFNFEKVAVVDMGWLGTIQRFLAESVAHRPDKPSIHGFVFAASRGIPYPGGPDNTLEGCVFDRAAKFDPAGCFVNCALDLFEEACRAAHPGITGYRKMNGRVEPVKLEETDPERIKEKRQDTYYADLQKGIRDSSMKFADSIKLLGYSFSDILPWLNYLMAVHLAFPKQKEIRALKYMHHLDDFGGRHSTPFKTRMRQIRLWGSSPWITRYIPFTRAFFFLLHLWRNPPPRQ